MCGIFGVVGSTNSFELINRLERLEYRGYDSCGTAYISEGKSYLFKSLGNTSGLRKTEENKLLSVGIGHTRWATHGNVSVANAHPHTTAKNRFYIVHNGVIDNYLDIINKYHFTMTSQTDSEVIGHMLDFYCQKIGILEAIKKIMEELIGSYAIVILDTKDDSRLFYMKNKSPLLIGIDIEKAYIASDQNAFVGKTNVTILNDYNYGYVEKNNYRIFSPNYNEKWETFYKEGVSIAKKTNEHYMLDEIVYQPIMILDIAAKYQAIINKEFIEKIDNCDEIVFVGAGSSYYAASILRSFYEEKTNKRCYSVIASEIDNYLLHSKNILFIFISQSGETADLCEALRYLQELDYPIISICNNINSSLGYKSDMIFPLFAKEEISVASTKALLAMIYVGRLLIDKDNCIKSSVSISKSITSVINRWNELQVIAEEISKARLAIFIGKGIDYISACEGSLKLREISYLPSFAFQSGELKHGSLALVDETVVSFAILSDSKNTMRIKNSLEEIKSRGGKTYLISNVEKTADIYVSGDIYAIIVILQVLAYQTALILKNNIDQPRNLAKSVTVL